jgi:hypothetical protein
MAEFEFLTAELERKKEHIQRAIDELKEAERTQTPEEVQRLHEAGAVAARRSRAAKKGWERRRAERASEAEPANRPNAA